MCTYIYDHLHKGLLLLRSEGVTITRNKFQDVDNDRTKE